MLSRGTYFFTKTEQEKNSGKSWNSELIFQWCHILRKKYPKNLETIIPSRFLLSQCISL